MINEIFYIKFHERQLPTIKIMEARKYEILGRRLQRRVLSLTLSQIYISVLTDIGPFVPLKI